MASANITMGVTGIDKTGAAFNSVRNRAKATGAQIRSVMGGAIAAAGAYLSFRSIKGGIDELGKLSDMAMKAGTSVEFLTRATTAFQVTGLGISQEGFIKALQYMQKNTGKQGEGAFFEIAKQIAAIPDAAERANAAVKVFGRSGLDMLPLVNNGQAAIEKFQTLQRIMPGVSSSAAAAGDAAADALTIFGKGAQTIGLKVVGKLCELFGQEFPGGVRAGALNAINWLETFFKKAYAYIAKYSTYVLSLGALVGDAFTKGPAQAWELYTQTTAAADADFEKRMSAANEAREKYVADLKTVNVDDLAGAFDNKRNMELAGDALGAAAAKRISNQLISGGSNDVRKLQVFGPQYQNEQKKQTSILEKIAKNTEKTAENTDGETYGVADL